MAQNPGTFTLKYFGLTIHPFGDETAHLQPYKLDKNAVLVGNFGAFIGYEKYIYKDLLSLKVIQAGFTDCSGGIAGFTHFGIRTKMFDIKKKHTFYFGIGPTLLYRKSWARFGEEYTSSGYFNELTINNRVLQYKMIPYAFEIEWDYSVNKNNDISFSFIPGIPLALIFSIGWKHWFNISEFKYTKLYIPRKRKKQL